jgi:hypothetical protein
MGRRDDKRKVHVQPFQGSNIRYGFATNVDQAESTQLGHTPLTTRPQGYIFGANSPKPARASRRRATGTVSSFISASAIATARQQGWRVGKAKLRRGGSTAKSSVVYVTIQGVKYAWSLPNDTATAIGNLQSLGIRQATAADTDLVFGASDPKPPQAYRTIGTGTDVDTISTFYDPTVTLPQGWQSGASGIDPLQGP